MNSTIQKECRKPQSASQMAVFDRLSNLTVELVAKLAEKTANHRSQHDR